MGWIVPGKEAGIEIPVLFHNILDRNQHPRKILTGGKSMFEMLKKVRNMVWGGGLQKEKGGISHLFQDKRNTFQNLGYTTVGQRRGDESHNLTIPGTCVMVQEFKRIRMDPAAGMISGIELVQLVFQE